MLKLLQQQLDAKYLDKVDSGFLMAIPEINIFKVFFKREENRRNIVNEPWI